VAISKARRHPLLDLVSYPYYPPSLHSPLPGQAGSLYIYIAASSRHHHYDHGHPLGAKRRFLCDLFLQEEEDAARGGALHVRAALRQLRRRLLAALRGGPPPLLLQAVRRGGRSLRRGPVRGLIGGLHALARHAVHAPRRGGGGARPPAQRRDALGAAGLQQRQAAGERHRRHACQRVRSPVRQLRYGLHAALEKRATRTQGTYVYLPCNNMQAISSRMV
jgi:hypothetical protein